MNAKKAKKLRKEIYGETDHRSREYFLGITRIKHIEIKDPVTGNKKLIEVPIGYIIADPKRQIYQRAKKGE